jgi:hypothetical protein
MRKMIDYLEAPVFKKNTIRMIGCPRSRSDADIWVRTLKDLVKMRLTGANRITALEMFSAPGICVVRFEWATREIKGLVSIQISGQRYR